MTTMTINDFEEAAKQYNNSRVYKRVDEISSNPDYYDVQCPYDNAYTLHMVCEDLKTVKRMIHFLEEKKFVVLGEIDDLYLRRMPEAAAKLFMGLAGGDSNLFAYSKNKYMKNEDGLYEFYFLPFNDKCNTLYQFIDMFGEKLVKLSNNTPYLLTTNQLDQQIEVKIYVADGYIQILKDSRINVDFTMKRTMYISSCMISLTADNDEQLKELGIEIVSVR